MLFFQFFNMLPRELDEAAEIDGASKFGIFIRVAIPLSVPMFIVGFIFSFVWYWNETYLTSLYMQGAKKYLFEGVKTLPMELQFFEDSFKSLLGSSADSNAGAGYKDQLNEAIYMAGTLISISPLLVLYFVLQRWFVEGIDKAGLTGQ